MVGAMPPADTLPCDVAGNAYGAKHLHLQLPAPPKQQPADEAECKWYEEEIDDDLKLCYALNSVLHRGASKYQEIALLDTKHFGKALIIDGKMQSTEVDEFIYHESLIHPPLLFHPNPKTVFIMGGWRGETWQIPVEGGPCYQLYTKSFYEHIVKPKLNDHGIFVTQAGPAGVLTHKEVFSSIYNTLKHVFKYVQAYTAHVPSFADTWGWVMASDHPFDLNAQQINERIKDTIVGELAYLSGESLISSTTLNKSVHQSLLNEIHVYTEDDARFVYGHGRACCA
ncbi:unnamed protein product [Urochloa decumbens]|uniref:PABS domain-containing protein n=1 Tax=Urochloa decumbens TaxID=240449 RepID=A0ABC9FHG3_9POAL